MEDRSIWRVLAEALGVIVFVIVAAVMALVALVAEPPKEALGATINYRQGQQVAVIPNTGICLVPTPFLAGYDISGNKVCVSGQPGPQGPAGPAGPAGPQGPPGPSGGSPSTPFTIPNQLHVGRRAMSQPIVDVIGGDNSNGGARGKPYSEEQTATGQPVVPTGRFWWNLNLAPTFPETGLLQLPGYGYNLSLAVRAGTLLQPPKETPNVVVLPSATGGFPAGFTFGFGVGYRVESSGGRTIQQVMTCATCPTTSACNFQVTFPHGTCDGNPNGTLCQSSADCKTTTAWPPNTLCQYVRNYLDGSPTDTVLYIGDCPPSHDVRDQTWPQTFAELKYPGDLVNVTELNERQTVAPIVDETGYVTMATLDPTAGWAAVLHVGDPVSVGEGVVPPTSLPGNPWYEVSTAHARSDGGGGTTVRGVTVTLPSLPAFRDDYADSCVCAAANDCVCIRKRGFTKAALITAAPSGACSRLVVTVDGKGSHAVGCQ